MTREFYQLIAHDIFNRNYALFESFDGVTYQPNSLSGINENHLTYFVAVGRIFGKAIFDGEILPLHFTLSFYKLLLGLRPSFQDFQAVDPDLHKNLKNMLESSHVDEWGLLFTVSVPTFDSAPLVQDLTDLSRIPSSGSGDEYSFITDENKETYASKVVEFRLKHVISEQIKAFQKGVYDVIPLELLRIFTPSELELLHCGLPHIDVDDLARNTEYKGGYSESSRIIVWFWEILRSYDEEFRGKLLQFVTGTSRVPHSGFAQLPGMNGINRFSIVKVSNLKHLPTSHTCYNQVLSLFYVCIIYDRYTVVFNFICRLFPFFLQLDLPEYPSKQVLQEKLAITLTSGLVGFGFS